MKKLFAVLLAIAMVLSLFAGCGKQEDTNAPAAQETQGSEELGLVGFSTISMSESIYVLEEAALKEIFDGKATVQTASCDNDPSTQISQISQMVSFLEAAALKM